MIFAFRTIKFSFLFAGARNCFSKEMLAFSDEWHGQVCKPKRILPWLVANVPRRQWNTLVDPRFLSTRPHIMYYAYMYNDVKAVTALLLEAKENEESQLFLDKPWNGPFNAICRASPIIVKLMLASQVYTLKHDLCGNSLVTISLVQTPFNKDGRNVAVLLANGYSLDNVDDDKDGKMLCYITSKMRAVERSYIECRKVAIALLVLKKRQHRQEYPFLLWSKYDRFIIREIVKELWTMRTLWEGPIELPLTEKGLHRAPLKRTMVRYLRQE